MPIRHTTVTLQRIHCRLLLWTLPESITTALHSVLSLGPVGDNESTTLSLDEYTLNPGAGISSLGFKKRLNRLLDFFEVLLITKEVESSKFSRDTATKV